LIPIAQAHAFVLASCSSLEPSRIEITAAEGHVLAESLHAPEDVPPFTNSAMDGFALKAADTRTVPARLVVVESVMAGQHTSTVVGDGEAIRIMTGAPIPRGADAVCMIEHTRSETGSVVVIEESLDPGTNVRNAGDDIAVGAEVFASGTFLGAAHIGVLASLGVSSVLVHPLPKVGVLSTGDELITKPGPLKPGKIRDSNRPALLSQLRRDGFAPVDLGVVGDDEVELTKVLEHGASVCDALVASGGVSVGDRDVVRLVLETLGGDAMRWMQIAVRPAKPFAFGTLGPTSVPVFGLPGNPVSALVSYELFVRPALRSMAGMQNLDRPRLSAIASVDLRRQPDGKVHLMRAIASRTEDGTLRVEPCGVQASHMLHAMADANALAIVPDGDGVAAGDRVEVLLLDPEQVEPPGSEGPW